MNRSVHRFASEDLAEAGRFYNSEAGVGLARRFITVFERVAKLLDMRSIQVQENRRPMVAESTR